MPRDHDAGAGLVMMAFIMGAVTGAAVGLLLAPTSGEETRRLLNSRAREGRGRAADVAERGREFVRQQRDQLAAAIDGEGRAYDGAAAGGGAVDDGSEQGTREEQAQAWGSKRNC